MTLQEEALARARAAAEKARAAGLYADDLRGFEIEPTDRVTSEQLLEWAVIEPDPDLVVSTRRLGAPITWVKRVLRHLFRQYTAQLESQQTRFNLHALIRIAELEDRVAALEKERGGRDDRPPGP